MRSRVEEVRLMGRATKGVRIMRIAVEDAIPPVATLSPGVKDEDVPEAVRDADAEA